MKKLILLLLSFFALSSAYTRIIYVAWDAQGQNNGNSWADAYLNLQDALEASSENETDTLWVKAGTYYPDREKNGLPGQGDPREWLFYSEKAACIYGGFAGNEVRFNQRNWQTNPTILDGDIGIPGLASDNAACIAFLGNTTHSLLDGFTIQNAYSQKNGGGLTVGNLDCVSLKNISIQHCYTQRSGAGLTAFHIKGGEISNITCTNNSALEKGGGFYLSNLSQVKLSLLYALKNTAGTGGGMYADSFDNVLIDGTFFCGNSATTDGGGLFARYFSRVDLVNSSFSENIAGKDGGASLVWGFSEVNFSNLTCLNNVALALYGGIGIKSSTQLGLYNSVFWENTDENGNFHSSSQISQAPGMSALTVSHSIIEGSNGSSSTWNSNLTDLGNNLDTDPGFVNTYGLDTLPCTRDDNYTPTINSPVIDAGSMSAPGIGALDANGKPRIRGGRVDLGACESQTSFAVEWLSFEGKYQGGRVLLRWETALERNSDYFVVQRMSEGEPGWSDLGVQMAEGSPKTYMFEDRTLAGTDRLRYRIKEIDLEGIESLSPEVEIHLPRDAASFDLNIFPNPASEALNIQLDGLDRESGLRLEINGMDGRPLYRSPEISLLGHRTILNIDFLPQGVYVLKARQGGILREVVFVKR